MAAPGGNPSELGGAGRIELRGVSKRYGSVEALSPFDLRIEDGEFFCLLGPSGCGKTTTLNLIGGFVPATSGEIWLGGNRIDGAAAAPPPGQHGLPVVRAVPAHDACARTSASGCAWSA